MSSETSQKSKKYAIILADPPWRFNVWNRDTGCGRSADSHYKTMTLDDIKELKIPSSDNSVLFMWAVLPQLNEALQVIKSWGFTFKTVAFVWVKLNKDGTPFTGMGYWTRANAEICLLATKGKISRQSKSVKQVILSQRQEHSKKPDEVRNRIVQLMGDLPRIELFARQKTEGWDVWGNEVESDIDLSQHMGGK